MIILAFTAGMSLGTICGATLMAALCLDLAKAPKDGQ